MTAKKNSDTSIFGPDMAHGDLLKKKRVPEEKEDKGSNRAPAVSIYLSEETHMRLKMASFMERKPMTAIVRDLVEDWLATNHKNLP